ncbi:hypothetical protein [Streptomyces sp. NPDC051219]
MFTLVLLTAPLLLAVLLLRARSHPARHRAGGPSSKSKVRASAPRHAAHG